MRQFSMNISFTPSMNSALDLMENTSQNLFITGKAGTGKSTLLTYFRRYTKKKVVVLAPTGVAALNVQGQTIHSFFRFKHSVTLSSIRELKKGKNLYKRLDAIIIDEVSMARADLLDCVDCFLRMNGKNASRPFGGIQMIFIGDLHQLPPVVTAQEKEIFSTHYKSPYFFSAQFFKTYEMTFVELDKIFRQQEGQFVDLLNAVRNDMTTQADINLLNQRVNPELASEEYVCLTPTNQGADHMNTMHLNALKGKILHSDAIIEGQFGKEYYPTRQTLTIKVGARIMMVNNDVKGRWINGTMGKVVGIEKIEKQDVIFVKLEDGTKVEVPPHTWEINRFFLESDTIKTEAIGSFTQYPLTLAWALTIHKSQGKTFHKVALDIGHGAFMPGQVYVALSRCTSLAGLMLKKPINRQDIWSDPEVVTFVESLQKHVPDMQLSMDEREHMIRQAVDRQHPIEFLYLNTANEKSLRQVIPTYVGMLKYQTMTYMGMKGFCQTSQANKIFRVDRIMEMKYLTEGASWDLTSRKRRGNASKT